MRDSVVILSDFEIDGYGRPMTGYSNIATALASSLYEEYNLINLGISYQRNQHIFPYYISQLQLKYVPSGVAAIATHIPNVKAIFMVLDIPLINSLREQMGDRLSKQKVFGVYAVEGNPLIFTWAKGLMKLNHRYAISEFGVDQCAEAYVKSNHFLVPTNRELWRFRTDEEKKQSKESHGLSDRKVIFYNADSNERKNTSALLQALSIAIKVDKSLHLVLLTRKNSPVGWNYDDFINEFQLQNNVTIVDRGGQPLERVWELYAMADLYVHPSKSEGLGLPILEAMSVGVPVIGTDCTAIHEHLTNGRGILVEAAFKTRDVFGNTFRYFVSNEVLAQTILDNVNGDHIDMVRKASSYIDDRNAKFPATINDIKEKINNG